MAPVLVLHRALNIGVYSGLVLAIFLLQPFQTRGAMVAEVISAATFVLQTSVVVRTTSPLFLPFTQGKTTHIIAAFSSFSRYVQTVFVFVLALSYSLTHPRTLSLSPSSPSRFV